MSLYTIVLFASDGEELNRLSFDETDTSYALAVAHEQDSASSAVILKDETRVCHLSRNRVGSEEFWAVGE